MTEHLGYDKHATSSGENARNWGGAEVQLTDPAAILSLVEDHVYGLH